MWMLKKLNEQRKQYLEAQFWRSVVAVMIDNRLPRVVQSVQAHIVLTD